MISMRYMIENAFAKLGVRLRFEKAAPSQRVPVPVTVNIRRDRLGEFFVLTQHSTAVPDIITLDVRPKTRHILVMAGIGNEKQKFLCGHDERHWFVAAIPETAAVSSVAQALAALKPAEVKDQELRQAVGTRQSNRRRNRAFVRQGEWFFVAQPKMHVPELLVLKREPLVRSRMGKPHLAEECYRTGGETVYVTFGFPEGLTEQEYQNRLRDDPRARKMSWRPMRRNPEVYVRGRVSHSDHRTVHLNCWHRVFMNTETQAKANAAVAFLD